jgi:hypothetical protein
MDRILDDAHAIGKALQDNCDQGLEVNSEALTTRIDKLLESVVVCMTDSGSVRNKFLEWSNLTKDILGAYAETLGMCHFLEKGSLTAYNTGIYRHDA